LRKVRALTLALTPPVVCILVRSASLLGALRLALAAARDFPGVTERIGEAGKVAESFSPVQYELRATGFGVGAEGLT
jgi:hypothetical protein